MKSIIVVEDDVNIRDLLVYALNNHGFRSIGLSNSQELYNHLDLLTPSLLILDIMLEGESGYEVLQNIRQNPNYRSIPVIILTAKDNEYDKVKGLDMGADDYITKPFGVLETISRIRAILRRTPENTESESVIEYHGIFLDAKKREVYIDSEKVIMTFKEFELLNFFLINKEIVLSRDKIINEVWGFDYSGESRTVDVHIRTLRQKLGEYGSYIKTIRNVGYKLGA